MEKIGFFETYNEKAQTIEKSSDRLKSVMSLIMVFLIVAGQFFLGEANFDTWGFIGVVFLFLLYSAAPKALKDMAAIKNLTDTLKK